jgi:hypothetical protein
VEPPAARIDLGINQAAGNGTAKRPYRQAPTEGHPTRMGLVFAQRGYIRDRDRYVIDHRPISERCDPPASIQEAAAP